MNDCSKEQPNENFDTKRFGIYARSGIGGGLVPNARKDKDTKLDLQEQTICDSFIDECP